jgi:ribosomal-protein-alanine N-acetyltransferase
MSAILKDPVLQMRPMGEADIDAVMDVEQLAYPFPWTAGIFRDCLRVGYCSWVYTLDKRIIGYGVMSVAVGEAHILNICVHPDLQGKGLGRRLIRRLLTLARKHGADTVFLEVRASNLPAIALYSSLGFNELGIRRGYYPADKGREDAVMFALSVGDPAQSSFNPV